MATHDKTIYCSTCNTINRIKRDWYKSPCRDCHSWGSSWLYYLLFRLITQHQDDQRMLRHLNRKFNSLLAWILEDLQPSIRDPTGHVSEETFLKALTLRKK